VKKVVFDQKPADLEAEREVHEHTAIQAVGT
jgi:hypothetical protein